MLETILNYVEHNQPIATITTGAMAICAVIISQIWLDFRQKRDHQHSYELKAKETALKKKEELIETISEQIKLISDIEDIFDSWSQNFNRHYSKTNINKALREADMRINKVHLLVEMYFPDFLKYIENIQAESQKFHELSADFAMAGAFGKEEFHKLDHIEIVEACNSYAVSYMQFSSLLVSRKESENPIIRKI